MDIYKRLSDLQLEMQKSMGFVESEPPAGRTFDGMGVGDRLEWNDHFVEDLQPNTLVSPRRLMGTIVHLHLGRWGWGVRIRLLEAPEGDPLKIGTTIFRWGSTLRYVGAKRVLQ